MILFAMLKKEKKKKTKEAHKEPCMRKEKKSKK